MQYHAYLSSNNFHLQAGPGTIAESMIRGLPIILNGFIAGQVNFLFLPLLDYLPLIASKFSRSHMKLDQMLARG